MKAKAVTIGALADEVIRSPLTVREVFASTAYLGSSQDMVILTARDERAPFTVNLDSDGREISAAVRPEERMIMKEDSLSVGNLSIDIRLAKKYHGLAEGRVDGAGAGSFPRVEHGLLQTSFALGLLYDTMNENDLALTRSVELRRFIGGVLVPFDTKGANLVQENSRYLGLLGIGSGFTPAGDDFLAGLIYVHNGLSERLNLTPIEIPVNLLHQRTSWASGMFLRYAQRGIADERLEAILHAIEREDGEGMLSSVLRLASRGHTSGIDVSLGMVLAAGAIHDRVTGRILLQKMLSNLGVG